jgi:predicted DNA-binding protein YlxM (UPF0122 family)
VSIIAKGKYREWITPDGLLVLKGYARDGLKDEEIADKIGISVATFYNWCNRFVEFLEAIKKGREPVNTVVEDTFLETKLKPQTVVETITEKTIYRDADGNITSSTEHVRKQEHYIPADTTAMIFYLKCRLNSKYNDKINVTVDKRNGQLADLIEGLKDDDIHTETESLNEDMANEQAETN